MSASFQVRIARPEDAPALAALNQALNGLSVAPEQVAARLHTGSHPEVVLLAEAEGQVVGFVCIQVLTSFCYAQPWAEVMEVYVSPAYRRRGFGRALVQAAEQYAQQQGATDLLVRTGAANQAGQALYQGLGYVQQSQVSFQKSLL